MPKYTFTIPTSDSRELDQFMQGAEGLIKQQWGEATMQKEED